MRGLACIGLLLCPGALLVLTGQAHAQSRSDSLQLEKAEGLQQKGDWRSAFPLYDALVKREVLLLESLIGRGKSWCYGLKDCDKGMEDLRQAISRFPKDMRPHAARGDMYLAMKMVERAREDYSQALEFAPTAGDSARIWVNIGTTHYQVRQFDRAKICYETAHAVDSTNTGSLFGLSNVLERQGDAEGALAIMYQLMEREPDNAIYMNNLAYRLITLERFAEAIQWYDKAIARDPKHGLSWNNRGYARMRSGDLKGALSDIERAIALNRSNSYAYRNLALVRKEMGQKDKSCAAFEKAFDLGYTRQYGPDAKGVYDAYCR
ncbi:MAG: tetratricopeptide repeat protein [Flavobacteriales bacterium]|nr:tetratricopeptide repeat protein [Flavobacteriales bacterium]